MSDSLLITAFEPSGDRLAAKVISRLREIRPELTIHAWGGPLMKAAGAVVHDDTVSHAAMGLGALAHVQRIRSHHRDILAWSREHQPVGLIPVDSPAANFPICKKLRPNGVKVIHLAAPQLWAWAPWRSRKLRRCTDLVLCLMPFEPEWFAQHDIPARFVGHPAIDRELDSEADARVAATLPQTDSRLLLMPGSRQQEINRNVPLMLKIVSQLREHQPDLGVVMTAVDEEKAGMVHRELAASEGPIEVVVGQRDAALHWSQVALAVSGTVTLDIMRHGKPMVGLYRTGLVGVLGAKVILNIKNRLLPNLIAGSRIVPEFVPYRGGPGPVSKAVGCLLDSVEARTCQEEAIRAALSPYENISFASSASDAILEVLDRQ